MKLYISVGMVFLVVPTILFAKGGDSGSFLQTLVNIEDDSKLLESISLWSALIIAFITSAMVWVGGRRMHGGIFGSALTFFSVGMSLIFISAATQISWFQGVPQLYLKMFHDTLFIMGYV